MQTSRAKICPSRVFAFAEHERKTYTYGAPVRSDAGHSEFRRARFEPAKLRPITLDELARGSAGERRLFGIRLSLL